MFAHIDTPNRPQASVPAEVWVQDNPNQGHYEPLDEASAAVHGWYPFDGSAERPADTATTRYERSVPLVNGTLTVTWTPVPKTQAETDAFNLAADRAAKAAAVTNAVTTLRSWAAAADSTTVTAGNAVTVLQTVVDRLGVFFDRFADLVESQGV